MRLTSKATTAQLPVTNRAKPVLPAHPALSEEVFDAITRELYQAAAGKLDWLVPLNRLSAALGLWAVHLFGIDKRVGSMLFSYEAGNASPEAGLDYLRTYQHVDPRLEVSLRLPTRQWFACQDHFDDAYVASSACYQDFLIPYGGRYLFGAKLVEDDAKLVFIGTLTRNDRPPLDAAQRRFVERIGHHIADAFLLQEHLRVSTQVSAVGFELLSRMRQPILLVDASRNITFRNQAAQTILDHGDILVEQSGALLCVDGQSSIGLSVAIRDMALAPINAQAQPNVRADRRSVKLKRAKSGDMVVVTLLALRPESTSGAFGPAPQALVTIYEPGRMAEPDPFLLSATFDLTPAESRLASRLCAGLTTKEIGKEFGISMNTIKGQLKAVFDKTGTHRQSDLVRLLITASTF